MAWRPYDNLIDGELDNRTLGKVTGWMRFFRKRKHPLRVAFDLEGDFHEDIRGTMIRLSNPNPSDPVIAPEGLDNSLSKENRSKGGDGNVTGIVGVVAGHAGICAPVGGRPGVVVSGLFSSRVVYMPLWLHFQLLLLCRRVAY